MSQIADAIAYLSRSLKLARTPELRRYVIIPLIFNILVFGGLYWLSGSWIAGWITAATADWALTGFWSFLNGALHFLVDAAVILVWILLLGLFASVFSIGVQLIAAPFMGFLAEKVDIQVTGHPMNDESIPAMIVNLVLAVACRADSVCGGGGLLHPGDQCVRLGHLVPVVRLAAGHAVHRFRRRQPSGAL